MRISSQCHLDHFIVSLTLPNQKPPGVKSLKLYLNPLFLKKVLIRGVCKPTSTKTLSKSQISVFVGFIVLVGTLKYELLIWFEQVFEALKC